MRALETSISRADASGSVLSVAVIIVYFIARRNIQRTKNKMGKFSKGAGFSFFDKNLQARQ